MVSLLISVLVIALVAYICFWCVDRAGVPYPISMIIKVIIAIIAIVALLTKTGLMPGGLGV
jgi:hypothetical protein